MANRTGRLESEDAPLMPRTTEPAPAEEMRKRFERYIAAAPREFTSWIDMQLGILQSTRHDLVMVREDVRILDEVLANVRLERNLWRADALRFRDLLKTMARMNWDGEELPDGTEYVQENDDARDTLMSLITRARDLLGDSVKDCGGVASDD